MELSTYRNVNRSSFLSAKTTLRNLIPYIFLGLYFGAILCYVLANEFYFYQAVLAAMFGVPIVILFLLYSPRRTLLGLLVLTIPFNPSFHLVRDNSTEFSLGIAFHTSDIIVIFIFVYVFISKINANDKKLKSFASIWHLGLPLMLWIVAGIVSILPADNKAIAILELVRMLRMYMIFSAVFLLVKKPKDIRFIAACLVIALSVQSVLVLMEYVLGQPFFRLPGGTRGVDIASDIYRPGGTMGHSGNYAKFATLCLPVCLAFMLTIRNNIGRIFFGGTCISTLLGLILTLSRAAIAASLFGLFWLLLIKLRTMKQNKLMVLALFIFLILGLAMSWRVGGNQLMLRIKDDGGSAITRPQMFSVAWNVIKTHPFLGVGLNNYTLIAPEYDRTREAISIEFPHPVHNIFLLYAAEIGIPGAVFFIWFLVGTILLAFKHSSQARISSVSVLLKAIGVGITCAWLQGLIAWAFRASIVHSSYLVIFAGALVALRHNNQFIREDYSNER